MAEPTVDEPPTRDREEDRSLRSWKQRQTIAAHAGAVRAMAIAPEATVSEDSIIKLWDVESGGELKAIRATYHKAPILRLAFSPEGRTIATAADDKMVRFWDVGKLAGRASDGAR